MKAHKRIVAIVQARMASTRLPGKVLADIAGEPMLMRVVERASRARLPNQVLVATTVQDSDDRVAALCQSRGVACFRGNAGDVLDRYYQAASAYQAEVIVRLTGDCPLLDPQVVDQTIEAFLNASPPVDLVVNRFVDDRTFPIGIDTEVVGFASLKRAWQEADAPHQREHVIPYIYEHPELFSFIHFKADGDYGHYRWTVDTKDDLEFVRRVFHSFIPKTDFGWKEILALLHKHPELQAINAHVPHRSSSDFDHL
jgi:spore coat polysaccharide biosynthesis protein SpsF